MKILGPSPIERINEAAGFVYLAAAVHLTLSLVSYHPEDPSWNVATGASHAHNLMGTFGSHLADLLLQCFGLAAFLVPIALVALGWMWIRSAAIEAPWAKMIGGLLMFVSITALFCVARDWTMFNGTVPVGGQLGL